MKKLDSNSIKARFDAVHGNTYDYSLMEYKNTSTKIKIRCAIHDVFEQTPSNHLFGNGCPKCANKNINTCIFIEKAKKLEPRGYCYSLVKYKTATSPIIVICKFHGEFEITPNSLLSGHGCAKCSGNKKLTLEDFITKAKEVHGIKYDYSKVEYKNNHSKIKIICFTHGIYEKTASKHINGRQGCPNCLSNNNSSKSETNWLDSLGIPNTSSFRQVMLPLKSGKYFKADGYVSNTNTVYEYFGDYWHGNPNTFDKDDINQINGKTFGILYNETIKKIDNIQDSGYNLVYIWENKK